MTPRTPLTIRTPRLLLRPLAEPDRLEYIHGHNDSADHLRPWSPLPVPGRSSDEIFNDELIRTAATEE